MTTYTWPTAIQPQACTLLLEPNIREWVSPYSGSYDAVDLMGERWRLTLALPPRFRSQGGALEALFNKLRGVHKLSLPYFARPVPVGTLRGSPLLNASVAQGATSLVLKNVRNGRNLLVHPSAFDNAAWTLGNGATVTPNTSGRSDTVTDANAGANSYVRQSITVPDDSATYTGSVYIHKTSGGTSATVLFQLVLTGGSTVTRSVRINTDTGAILSGTANVVSAGGGTLWRVDATVTNDSTGNTTGRFEVYPAINTYGLSGTDVAATGSAQLRDAQFELGSTVTAYEDATLLAGDLLGLGGQWLQVADDATVSAAGTMTVTLANRVRVAAASGDAVTWSRPEATFRLAAPGVPVTHAPGVTEGLQIELIEAW